MVSYTKNQTEERDSLWLRGIVVVFFFIFQRRLVRARLEQDFLAQTKFQSDASAIHLETAAVPDCALAAAASSSDVVKSSAMEVAE